MPFNSATISELPPTIPTLDLYSLLESSLPLDSDRIAHFLTKACQMEGLEGPVPEPVVVKYSDIIFHSYHPLGLSLGFSPSTTSTPSQLIQIDLFNPPVSPSSQPTPIPSSRTAKPTFSPALCSILSPPLFRTSTARELLLSELGEPSRKGGGEPNLGRLGLGVWMEWERERGEEGVEDGGEGREGGEKVVDGKEGGEKSRRGIKIEFDERGAGCWERDRLDKAVWRECGLFLS